MVINPSISEWKFFGNTLLMGALTILAIRQEKGETEISISTLSQLLHISSWQARDILNKLEETGVITKETTNKNTRITFCKYVTCKVKTTSKTASKTTSKKNGNQLALFNSETPYIQDQLLAALKKKTKFTAEDEQHYAWLQNKKGYGAEDWLVNVWLSDTEHNKLLQEYGPDKTEKIIRTLSYYKNANEVTYKNDYAAIRNWVVQRIEQENSKKNESNSTSLNPTAVSAAADFIQELYN